MEFVSVLALQRGALRQTFAKWITCDKRCEIGHQGNRKIISDRSFVPPQKAAVDESISKRQARLLSEF